ncbi:hypothetical protein ACRN9T_12620 [Shewanella baltica]|uniref:hypothetical protein n=1 Tax=Shewanella baltica TaxID=62322 RepID=UPI003D7AB0B9
MQRRSNMRIWSVLIGLFFCISVHATSKSTAETTAALADKPIITMAFYEDPKHNFYFKWAELIYTQAFERLGYGFSYQVVPAARASMMADSGKVDGEPGRVFNYGEKFTNLIRIEEPVVDTHLIAFAHNPKIKITNWQALQKSRYKIEYYRGVFLAEQKLKGLIPNERLTESSSPVSSFRKMLRDRIDIYIDTEASSLDLLQTPEFQGSEIIAIATLEELTSYGYLNKRHAALAVNLARELKQMKQEGIFETYKQQARKSLNDAINNGDTPQ